MSTEKEYLYIAGDDIIFINKDDDENVISVSARGVTFEKLEELERFSNYEKYANSNNPLLDFAKDEMVKSYKEQLKNERENFLVLGGAGTSYQIGKEKKGILISELWDKAKKKLGNDVFEEICQVVNHDLKDKNIETLLSRIQLSHELDPKGKIEIEIEGDVVELSFSEIITEIETTIKSSCSLLLPENSPHELFLDKITKRKSSSPRIKIFTNYDTLFEQAANKINGILIDGFSFTGPRTFSGRNFDYDIVKRDNSRLSEDKDFIERVIHLYKLHGSVNWDRKGQDIIINEETEDPLMIYPRSSKYESSYEQPYFEMMSRFQANLRKTNVTLLSIGFSFNDKHLVTTIFEALNQNPSFKLIIVDPCCGNGNNKTFQKLINDIALKSNRVIIIEDKFESFAENIPEIGTYSSKASNDIHIHLDKENNEHKSI